MYIHIYIYLYLYLKYYFVYIYIYIFISKVTCPSNSDSKPRFMDPGLTLPTKKGK